MLSLETLTVLVDAMRHSLASTTPPKTPRACLAAVRATLRLTDLVDRRPAGSPTTTRPKRCAPTPSSRTRRTASTRPRGVKRAFLWMFIRVSSSGGLVAWQPQIPL